MVGGVVIYTSNCSQRAFSIQVFCAHSKDPEGQLHRVGWGRCRARAWPRLTLTLIEEWFLEIVDP